MTTQQLTFKSLPALPLTEGATTPNLGVNSKGAWAWSDTLSKPVFWDGAKWTAGSTGGGTALAIQATTVNFPVANYAHGLKSVAAAGVTTASRVNAWLAPNAEWDADELVGYTVTAVPKTGSIDFYLSGIAPLIGNFDIYYFWS
jgi:hypothetical protein